MHVATNTEIIIVACDHAEDDKQVSYTYTGIDNNITINESIENEIQEVNIPFDELIKVVALIDKKLKLKIVR